MNRDHFKSALFQKTLNLNADDLVEVVDKSDSQMMVKNGANSRNPNPIKTIIIDCSTISYIDTAGVETLGEIVAILKDMDIRCLLASCPTQLLTMFERMRLVDSMCSNYSGIFPSVHDAVVHCSPTSTPKNVRWSENVQNAL